MEIKVNRKAAVKKLKSLVLTPKSEVESFRTKIEKNFDSVFLPNKVENTERTFGDVKCDYLTPEVYVSHRILLYIHGGSFVGGSRESWRSFCSSIANETMSRVIVPDFRLPPSHPYPAALEDVQNVFRLIKGEEELSIQLSQDKNALPQIILAADTSGASILMALMFSLSENLRKSVDKIFLFSPWLDLGSDNSVISRKKMHDEVISSSDLRFAVDLYTYSSNVKSIFISPLKASAKEFSCFPEFYIQSGEKEILLSQAYDFKNLLESAGIKCTLDVFPKMMYMFQMADEFLPQSHSAIENIGKWINLKPRDDIKNP